MNRQIKISVRLIASRQFARLVYTVTLLLLGAVISQFLAGCKHTSLLPYSKQDELKFRSDRARDLADPRGNMGIIFTTSLEDGSTTFGPHPAKIPLLHLPSLLEITRHGSEITVSKAPLGTTVDGKSVVSGTPISLATSSTSSHWLTVGDVSMRTTHTGDRFGLVIYDSESPFLQPHPLHWFPPSEAYRIKATWIPITRGQPATIHRTSRGSDLKGSYAGYAEFSLSGKSLRLYGLLDRNEIFFVFRDLTSRTTTDETGRFIEARFSSSAFVPSRMFNPAKRANMMLDFNQAVNPDCAYNPNIHCPIAPPENRLPVAIPAGEERY